MAKPQPVKRPPKGGDKVLIVASGTSANKLSEYPYKEKGWKIYAVNNANLLIPDFDVWVHATDYKGKRPGTITADQFELKKYVPIMGNYGGMKATGYGITISAGYCALWNESPSVIGFLGADMNYTPAKDGSTSFYGVGYDIKNGGVADPDHMAKRYGNGHDNYLYYIYMRMYQYAADDGCSIYNFSQHYESRLPFPMANPEEFE